MDRLEFHTQPLTAEQRQRFRSSLRQGQGFWSRGVSLPFGATQLRWPLAAVLFGCALIVAAGTSGPAVLVNGAAVRGSRILVVEDVSGSMDPLQDELKSQKSQLGNSLFDGELKVYGFGVASAGDDTNLLHVLERGLPAASGVDTIYVFSDFDPETPSIDCNDRGGLDAFRQLIRSRRVRLYLSTVNMQPSSGLLAIARESGGGLLGGYTAVDSLQIRQSLCNIAE